jgi:hypothetical protein
MSGFRDAAFTMPESSTPPCSWHWGLVASDCSTTATMGTSHVGKHVFAGNDRSYAYAYDRRAREPESAVPGALKGVLYQGDARVFHGAFRGASAGVPEGASDVR